MKENVLFLGTEIKLNVHIDPVNNLTMDEYDFDCEFFCHPNKRVKKTKFEMLRVDAENYIALLDTKDLGTGTLHCKVSAYLPDTYGDADWVRTEVWLEELDMCIMMS